MLLSHLFCSKCSIIYVPIASREKRSSIKEEEGNVEGKRHSRGTHMKEAGEDSSSDLIGE